MTQDKAPHLAAHFVWDVPASFVGKRLDVGLTLYCKSNIETVLPCPLTRSRVQALIVEGHVQVDGKTALPSQKLKKSQLVEVQIPPAKPQALVPENLDLEILYEDAHVIAVNKPAGMTVHPGAGRHTGTLVHALLAHCDDLSGIGGVERPGIVHRLDRNTSGVLIAAKNDLAHGNLQAQFANRLVHKQYVAFVMGIPKTTQQTLKHLLARDRVHRTRFAVCSNQGKTAITSYVVKASGGNISKLDVNIKTGRTHQIRVQLSTHGHPVVADAEYGGCNWTRIRDSSLCEKAKSLSRQALHASKMHVLHPISKKHLALVAPMPNDLEMLWQSMQACSDFAQGHDLTTRCTKRYKGKSS